MSITLETKQLRAVAAETDKVALGGGGAPIFANVLIREGAGGRVCFAATDLDTAIERHITAITGELARDPLNVTVSSHHLSAIAKKLPADAQVRLAMEDGARLALSCGRSRFTLVTLPAEDFPAFPVCDWAAQFELPAALLKRLIATLAFAISTDAARYYLNGLYFHRVETAEGAVMRVAATDGSRLARAQIAMPDGAEGFPAGQGVIVPRQAVKVIGELIDGMAPPQGETAMVGISLSSARIELDFGAGAHGETRFTAKLIDGTFPEYSRVIPTGNPRVLKICREVLREAVDRVTTIASEKVRAVKLALDKGLVTLSVVSPEAGQATEEIPADYDGASFEIGFNARYLLDVLDRIEGDTAVAELDGEASPTLWRESADAETLFVLMPLRI